MPDKHRESGSDQVANTTHAKSFVEHRTLMLALMSALVASACTSGGGFLESINSAPPDTGPGCYDHKNRIERTITTAAECATMSWVWKP